MWADLTASNGEAISVPMGRVLYLIDDMETDFTIIVFDNGDKVYVQEPFSELQQELAVSVNFQRLNGHE